MKAITEERRSVRASALSGEFQEVCDEGTALYKRFLKEYRAFIQECTHFDRVTEDALMAVAKVQPTGGGELSNCVEGLRHAVWYRYPGGVLPDKVEVFLPATKRYTFVAKSTWQYRITRLLELALSYRVTHSKRRNIRKAISLESDDEYIGSLYALCLRHKVNPYNLDNPSSDQSYIIKFMGVRLFAEDLDVLRHYYDPEDFGGHNLTHRGKRRIKVEAQHT